MTRPCRPDDLINIDTAYTIKSQYVVKYRRRCLNCGTVLKSLDPTAVRGMTTNHITASRRDHDRQPRRRRTYPPQPTP